ncbi:leucine dehydrogenase, partial [Geobacillus stearothermophilus]|nr:leucine dehydrogenase [Geobacillus stearothermophilus]
DADDLSGSKRDRARKNIAQLKDNSDTVGAIAKRDNIPPYVAADRRAEERIATMRQARSHFLPKGHHLLSRRRAR